MAWNPNVPTITNRVQDDLDAIRENFQHLDQLAERVDELQTVSELAPIANDLQTVSELTPVVGELQTVSELAQITDDLQVVSALAPYAQALLDSRIVEMGSNSNGEYVRWENGLQVCWFRRSTTGRSITAPFGALYSDQTRQLWTFPAAFVSSPVFVGTSEGGSDRHPFVKPVSASATSLDYVCVAAQSGTFNMLENLMAIGWWK